MANWSDLKSGIAKVIRTNGAQEITGKILQDVLNSIISNVGKYSTFAGIATPDTNPGVPDGNVFYLAAQKGTYANFAGINVNETVKIIINKGGGWQDIDTGIPNSEALNKIAIYSAGIILKEGKKKVSLGGKLNFVDLIQFDRTYEKFKIIVRTNPLADNWFYSLIYWKGSSTQHKLPIDFKFNKEYVLDAPKEYDKVQLYTYTTSPGTYDCDIIVRTLSVIDKKLEDKADKENTNQQFKDLGGEIKEIKSVVTGNVLKKDVRIVEKAVRFDIVPFVKLDTSVTEFLLEVRTDKTLTESWTYFVFFIDGGGQKERYEKELNFNEQYVIPAKKGYETIQLFSYKGAPDRYEITSSARTISDTDKINERISQVEDNQKKEDYKYERIYSREIPRLLLEVDCKKYKGENIGIKVYPTSGDVSNIDVVYIGTLDKNGEFINSFSTKWNELVYMPIQLNAEKISVRNLNAYFTNPSIVNVDVVTALPKVAKQEKEIRGINRTLKSDFAVNVSGENVPVVAFVYDDYVVSGGMKGDELVNLFEERGMKVSFAVIGDTKQDGASWKSDSEYLKNIIRYGHGCCAHGGVLHLDVDASLGLGNMNDVQATKVLEAENRAFKLCGLPYNGLVKFNTHEDTPRTWEIMGRYYKYAVGFGNGLNTVGESDLLDLKRYNTDSANMLPNAKKLIDEAILKGNCLVLFGGHYGKRTSAGGIYSTKEDFIRLLDYINAKMKLGQIVSLSVDDAVNEIWGRAYSTIAYRNYNLRPAKYGDLKISDNKIEFCKKPGNRALYKMNLTGAIVKGSFSLKLNGILSTSDSLNDGNQTITIQTTQGDTLDDVKGKIISSVYKGYNAYLSDDKFIYFSRPISGDTFTPQIESNTSGILFDITEIKKGDADLWAGA